jgi:hypothetical protein
VRPVEHYEHQGYAETDKGLKYNLHSKPKTCIKTLAVEAVTAIRTLPEKDQAYTTQLVANNIQKLMNKQNRKKINKTKHTDRVQIDAH